MCTSSVSPEAFNAQLETHVSVGHDSPEVVDRQLVSTGRQALLENPFEPLHLLQADGVVLRPKNVVDVYFGGENIVI